MPAALRYIRKLAGAIVVIKRKTAVSDHEQIGFGVVVIISRHRANRRASELRGQGATDCWVTSVNLPDSAAK